MAHALADSGARILILERGDFVPQEDENWSPEAVWKQLRYRREDWLDERGREFRPYTHYGVGGNTKFWGSVLYRLRREDFQARRTCDGVSPAWPIDYDTLEPYYERAERLYHVHGQDGIDPTEPPRGPFPYRARSARAGDGGDRRAAARPGPASLAAAARAAAAGRARRLHPVQHLQFVPLQAPREERRRRLLHPPGASHARTSRCGPNARARRLITDPVGRRSKPSKSSGTARCVRVEAPVVVVSCGAVNSAALLLRSANDDASRRPGEFVRARRQALHGAPGDDDAGLPSVPQERDGVSEDGGDQRFLLARAGQRRIRSGRSSRRAGRTASWRRRPYPWIPLWAYERGSRAASTGWRCPRTCRIRTIA